VVDVGVGEADVEPNGVENRGAGDCSTDERKLRVQILDCTEIEQPRLRAKSAELGERREQDVELTAAGNV
jgi:hypothetical protein